MTENTAPTTASSELALQAGQSEFTPKQAAALAQLGVKQAGPADLAVFFHQCAKTGLDPFARQIYMISRGGKQTIQTAIDGFRVIARRAADKAGETIGYDDTLWCGEDGQWVDVWLKKTAPAAAKVTIYRGQQKFSAVALWSEYGSTQAMWKTMPTHMLAKVAEALVLRKAFPQDLSGVYTDDEMAQADGRAPAATADNTRQRQAAPAPAPERDPNGSTPPQWGEIAAYLDELGHTANEAKGRYIQEWSAENGRKVERVRELTSDEAVTLIAHLQAEFAKADEDDEPAVLDAELVD